MTYVLESEGNLDIVLKEGDGDIVSTVSIPPRTLVYNTSNEEFEYTKLDGTTGITPYPIEINATYNDNPYGIDITTSIGGSVYEDTVEDLTNLDYDSDNQVLHLTSLLGKPVSAGFEYTTTNFDKPEDIVLNTTDENLPQPGDNSRNLLGFGFTNILNEMNNNVVQKEQVDIEGTNDGAIGHITIPPTGTYDIFKVEDDNKQVRISYDIDIASNNQHKHHTRAELILYEYNPNDESFTNKYMYTTSQPHPELGAGEVIELNDVFDVSLLVGRQYLWSCELLRLSEGDVLEGSYITESSTMSVSFLQIEQ